MHPEFAPVAFIAAFSLVLPLPWHWRAGNVATLSIMFWLFIANMIYAIDAVVWKGSIDIVGVVWCDISTKLIMGTNIALPAACLCICIHLEQVASVRLARTSQSDKRRRQIFELLMCFALPFLYMILHYIVQGHRFDIIEDYGCRPTVYFSVPSIILIWIAPIVLSLASIVFGGLALRHFIKRRISFAAHLDASHSALTTSRYLRLMLMSMLEMVWSIAVTSYTLWFNFLSSPVRPYTSWADVHSNFSRIDVYPTAFLPPLVIRAYYFLWWLIPISTFAFVTMFAFGRDAVEDYKKFFLAIRTRVLPSKSTSPSSKGAFDKRGAMELPSYDPKLTAAPAYPPPTPPSPSKFDESDYDLQSETSSHYGPWLSYKGDPVLVHEDEPQSPSTTTSRQWTPRPLLLTGSPTRPVTYPSSDHDHRGLNASHV